MGRFLIDSVFVVLLLLVGVGIFVNDNDSSSQLDSTIEEFDDTVSGDGVVDDGYLEDVGGIVEYEGNGIAKTVEKISDGIIDGVNYGFELIINIVRGVIN